MRLPMKCMVFLACWASALATPAKIEDGDLGAARTGSVVDSSHRDSRLLFAFITIAAEVCSSPGGKSGICYSSADCTTLSGTPDGTCAKGFGVCCLITRTCEQVSAFQETTFVNPNYPSTEPAALGSCRLRITPLNDNICQLRLDLEEFTLSQPNPEGECDRDFLQVVAGSSNVPQICGDNTGQHLGSKWKIKVTQIECNSADRAPSGCLQYFTSTTGTITSFNFNPARVSTAATRQLADQMYGVCIKSQPGYCSITYTQRDGSTFSLSSDPTALAPGILPIPVVGSGVSDGCLDDYLLIPGGVIEDTTNVSPVGSTDADRYCGLAFPGATTFVQPFNLFVVTNDDEAAAGDINNQGFELTYRMNAC
ncbi:CUB domain [Trinorchestia longiramus]|nr:CUB domain [Trinorchestia longiramus]